MHISNSSIKKQVSCFKKIIRTNNIEDSIDIICETENDSTKKKLGKKKAFEIYCELCPELYPYSEKKYGNNISKYQKLINLKIKKAYNHIQ
tara:strand:+ start:810 stop:1082 length:273 start_codon:yes stop_codon:yes gene_type:complete